MAEQDLYGGSIERNGIQIANANGEGQTQNNSSSTSWLIEIKNALNPEWKPWHVSKKVCINRVPEPIRISNPKAYAPMVVSLGPYRHRISHELFIKDEHKLEALRRTSAKIKKDVTFLVGEIRKLESTIRECYDEKIEFDGETLSYMFAMDACFILECLKCANSNERESNINCFSLVFQTKAHQNTLHSAIKVDILKLENQIPLIVLVTRLELESGSPEDARKSLARLLCNIWLFKGYPFTSSGNDVHVQSGNVYFNKMMHHIGRGPCHLLDLYRMAVIDLFERPNFEPRRRSSEDKSCRDSRSTPSAEQLQKTGIKFEPGPLEFEKRWFGTSTISFPQLTVADNTETLLRNLMAYEECQRCSWKPQNTVISHYVSYLDNLIDSAKDVPVLRKSLVIRSMVGSNDEIASLFNRLGDGISLHGIEEIENVMKNSREHYKSLRKVWMSQFREEHCSNPWKFLSVVAAILILGMTAVQTVYSVKK